MIIDKKEFIESLSKEQFNNGCIKFNIPDEEDIHSLNGEGVWGWITDEDKNKYYDDSYFGKMKVILLNQPLEYYGRLNWGDEVVVQCHGADRPILDPDWVMENLK